MDLNNWREKDIPFLDKVFQPLSLSTCTRNHVEANFKKIENARTQSIVLLVCIIQLQKNIIFSNLSLWRNIFNFKGKGVSILLTLEISKKK